MWINAIIFFIFTTECFAFEEKDMICSDDYCAKYVEDHGCPKLSEACLAQNETHNGVFLPFPQICNCCRYCVTNLMLGEACVIGTPGMPPPSTICGPGLTCKAVAGQQATCQRIDSTSCAKCQTKWETLRVEGKLGMTVVKPQCDEDGQFTPVHCIPGSLCYCLSSAGNRIFGEKAFLDHSDEHKMTCGCSLNYNKALESVNPEFKEAFLSARCNEYGLFDPLQCMMGEEAKCYCVSPISGEPRSEIPAVPVSELRPGHPSCFDSKLHVAGAYESECEIELREWQENLEMSTTTTASSRFSSRAIGFTKPKCQPDGKYHRVQTLGTNQICVDPSGQQIEDFGAPVDSEEAKSMNCNCARARYLLRREGVLELPKCNARGSFDPVQCLRGQCYCVDCNGDQIGVEKSSEEFLPEACAETCCSLFCLTDQ
ncbi:uncharacterized protein [Venturia canescens]|uniref:uncharacterized protein n=1 Tax=Venturia canescens TaxID=32260 RepID=UPI001C9D51D0|nr:uncharacterized protein LOC122417925 [Venturia canescens]